MVTVTATRSGTTTPVLDFHTTEDADAWLDMLSGLYWAEPSMLAARTGHTLTIYANTPDISPEIPADHRQIIATYQIEDTTPHASHASPHHPHRRRRSSHRTAGAPTGTGNPV